MLKTFLFAALLFTGYDANRVNEEAKFEVGRYYKHPYTTVIYIREQVVMHNGTIRLVVENVQGRYCMWPYNICDIPANTKRDKWVEVERID